MNEVKLTGTLTKEPYQSAKGWIGATLAVKKAGTDYSLWVSLYAPSGEVAKIFQGAQKNEAFYVEGELDETKDQQGNKRLQVKVRTARRAAPPVSNKNYANPEITDADIPF